ncbi:hypothetical protein [uncultured Faecalibaculum sp.]|uniref:hypothetical protein n=1 Tax=uncultured Faecalibaculum sp. TaxID=1729681 RepID=UPI0025FA8360|nr:hypothetical protein [uncultured Faecalibaculum sp.]
MQLSSSISNTFSSSSTPWIKNFVQLCVEDIFNKIQFYKPEVRGKEYQTFNGISYEGKDFVFTRPIVVIVEKTDGGYFLEIEELNIYLFAEKKSELNELLGESIAYLWDTFVQGRDAEFDKSGIDFKRKLESLVRLN